MADGSGGVDGVRGSGEIGRDQGTGQHQGSQGEGRAAAEDPARRPEAGYGGGPATDSVA